MWLILQIHICFICIVEHLDVKYWLILSKLPWQLSPNPNIAVVFMDSSVSISKLMMSHYFWKTKRMSNWELCFSNWIQKGIVFCISTQFASDLVLGGICTRISRCSQLQSTFSFCFASTKSSFNNQLGMALFLWQTQPCIEVDLAVQFVSSTLSWGQTRDGIEKLQLSRYPRQQSSNASIFMQVYNLASSCFRDSCYAERNVNRVPGGAGMWVWVKRTHAGTIYYWPADMVIFFLMLSSARRGFPAAHMCQYPLWRNVPYWIHLSVYWFLTAPAAIFVFSQVFTGTVWFWNGNFGLFWSDIHGAQKMNLVFMHLVKYLDID